MDTYSKIEKALTYIKLNSTKNLHLDDVAKYINISPFYFQKLFKEWAGVTPKQFNQFLNIEYAKTILAGNNLAEVTYTIGLSSPSRLHDLFITIEAMTPAEYRDGGRDLTISYSINTSKFGKYIIATTEKGVCSLSFISTVTEGIKELESNWPNAQLIERVTKNQKLVIDYFNNLTNSKIKLHLKGTNFQLKIWNALLKIPEGNLKSYSQIGTLIDSKSYRAIGNAIGANPISFIIPCHRVINSTGKLGNYRWGIERKLAMIGYEASELLIKRDNIKNSLS